MKQSSFLTFDMAPPRASKNFEQRQPITTTLRNICESYPPNTCLRELLQNADDARASEVEFVLDTRNHASNGPFLHDGLAQYAGPALLARNNSVFTEKDFGSLSSVGDSGKRNDPETIGKFGQGFNSVGPGPGPERNPRRELYLKVGRIGLPLDRWTSNLFRRYATTPRPPSSVVSGDRQARWPCMGCC